MWPKLRGRTEKSPECARRRGHEQVPAGVLAPQARSAWRRRPPALQESGLAARPGARRGGGEESRVARLGLSVGSARPERGSREPRIGRGGEGRGGAGCSATAPLVPLRPPPSFWPPPALPGPRARRSAEVCCRLPGSGRATHGHTEGQTGALAGRVPPPRPECRVTPGAACPVPAGAGARPLPPTCAPFGLEPAIRREADRLFRCPPRHRQQPPERRHSANLPGFS